MRCSKHSYVLAFLVVTAGATVSRAQSFDVKTGLWETTTTSDTNGMPAIDTSRMTPEQRARVEGVLKARAGRGPTTRTNRSCMTKEKLEKKSLDEMADRNPSCKTTLLNASSTVVDMKMECSGPMKGNGTVHFEALSRENVKGSVKLVSGDEAHPMTINLNMTSKWLGDACGDVK